ncbi:MAG TPA: hypothetical protein VFJ15_14320 [Oleiagrimonas sp.]|nr:hypothetical protein [Oleiagrimonas sp.]
MPELLHIRAEDVAGQLTWHGVVEALRQGHMGPKASMDDMILARDKDTLLNRAAWVPELGMGLKTVTVMAGNKARGLPSVQGVVVVFNNDTGAPEAVIDNEPVTYWKTAADSGLGARLLARPDMCRLLVIGAGRVAHSLAEVYTALFPELSDIAIWSRTAASAERLACTLERRGMPARAIRDLPREAGRADAITCATMAYEPVLKGEWVQPGTHVDLVGAYRADMREADDARLRKSRIFVDSRETTLDHIGEMKIPLAEGVITRQDVLGDLYELCQGKTGRQSPEQITVYKNGGGAHLDLITARAIIKACLDCHDKWQPGGSG